ncbi:MAG TPA: alpha-amylase family glycosyl hydrolase, partial [Ktedonobacterales bacterium]|nr:alpha-amylase family glycosyl hydrolase [Ktedonobacterales bacterium]
TLYQLVEEAHARGIRVLLDFIANHTSHLHPRFQQALADPSSEAANWYVIGADWPEGYAAFANVASMPELATDRPEVQRDLIGAALDWLSHYGVDGLRLDYVPGPSYAFWASFQRDIKQHFPNALTLAEINEPLDDITLYTGCFDAFMDFPLTRLLRQVFAQRTVPLAQLLTYLEARAPRLPAEMSRATLLDNHDMHRFLWLAQGKSARLKLAATCQMTVPGTPIVYYGTEVGLSQADDARKENAYARAPMVWDARQDQSIYEHFSRLIALRAAHPALRYGTLTRLDVWGEDAEDMDFSVDERDQVGAYLRIHDDEVAVIVLNNAEHPVKLRVATGGWVTAQRMCDALRATGGDDVAVVNGEVHLALPPMSAALLVTAS